MPFIMYVRAMTQNRHAARLIISSPAALGLTCEAREVMIYQLPHRFFNARSLE